MAPRGPWLPQGHHCSGPHQSWHKDCSGLCHHNRYTRGPHMNTRCPCGPRGPLLPEVYHCFDPHQSWHKHCSGVYHHNRNARGPMWPPGAPGCQRHSITLVHTNLPQTLLRGLPSSVPKRPLAARCAPLLQSM